MAVPDIRPRRSLGWYGVRRYRLQCPAACDVPTVLGAREAGRVVGQHPAVCPDPGPVVGGIHPLVYADQVA